ncbi:MAG TPA: MaoC family dehydratase N-terminal domain-containing protein [Pseudonocardiaceae bacterium]|nr:MaoC family dehydratase N-terminal domain-containing protein [Pseudonocardiaceae bacterium]
MTADIVDEVAFDVERGKIAEFARATFAEDPVHTDPDAAHAAGFDAVPATATHVVVAGHHRDQRGFVDKLGLAFERVVVGSVKWTYLRPLRAGDSLRGARRVVDDVRKRGGALRVVTLETEYVDAAGQPAVRVTEVLIERGE